MTTNFQFLKLGLILLMPLYISGCATNSIHLPEWFTMSQETTENEAKSSPKSDAEGQLANQQKEKSASGLMYRQEPSSNDKKDDSVIIYRTPKTLYSPSFTHKSLADYAEQLAMQLIDNARGITSHSLVGVTSFVNLDSTLQKTDVLGNQLAELFIGELQQFGISVVDFKTTNTIMVEPTGDYIFSRDTDELASELDMDYVLSGTLIRNEKGVHISARIIALSNRRVTSTASILIPHFIVEELSPRYLTLSP